MNADVTVREMMDREYVGVSESDDLLETVELLLREDAETAVVQRGSEHVGVLTERDILAALVGEPDLEDATVGDVMTESVPTITPDETLDVVADKISTRESGRLVVTNGTEPLGVITERDLLATSTHEFETGPGTAEGHGVHGTAEDRAVRGTSESPAATAGASGTGDIVEQAGETYQEQSICEGCGKLANDLASFNGQLLCPDCRDI